MLVSIVALCLCTAAVTTIQIPFVRDASLIAISQATSVTLTNLTCEQCLCLSNSSHFVLNCFPDSSCQLFTSIPRTYSTQLALNARLYFLQGVFPNNTQCCLPNTSLLFDKLNTATPNTVNVINPRCILLDDRGYLVTVSYTAKTIFRFYANNLTLIDLPASPIFSDYPYSVAQYNGAYYVAFDAYILVVHSGNMSQIGSITSAALSGARDMVYVNNGQTMIVASTSNYRLVFFNRSSSGSYNYDYIGYQTVNYAAPHGLLYVNETFFYATSWGDGTVYAYSSSGNATSWTEKLALDVGSSVGHINTRHVFVDQCGRYWLSSVSNGVKIISDDGFFFDTFSPMGSLPFDTFIGDNYVVYLSDPASNRLIRVDPNIQC